MPNNTTNQQLTKRSKQLSWLLRHGAYDQGFAMDEAGWMNVQDVLTFLNMSRAELKLILNTNNKQRIQLRGQRVRACQGHSTNNRAVTQVALEASWLEYKSDASIWHGTTVSAMERIALQGILPMARTHVHCTPTIDSTIGKRATSEVMIEISPVKLREAGLNIYIAPNGTLLVRRVPPKAIVGCVPLTRRAKKRQAELERSMATLRRANLSL